MLIFIGGLMAYLAYVMSMPYLIELINDMSAGKSGNLAVMLDTVNTSLWVWALVGALLLTARAANAIQDFRSSRSSENGI